MNRRGFLGLFTAGVAAAAVLDPERLLWVPGQKKIFIPPPPSIGVPGGTLWIDDFERELQKCLGLIWDGEIERTPTGKLALDEYMKDARREFQPYRWPVDGLTRTFPS